MKISLASGKGGTGKTTVAVNLALALAGLGESVTYADCDVEEPNGHIFLRSMWESSESVGIPIPAVDSSLCTDCGECGAICRFSAIVCLGGTAMTFPELCKGCGGCSMVCAEKAISESVREVGVVETGSVRVTDGDGSEEIHFVHGKLRIGEAQSPPLIRRVKERIPDEGVTLLDAPPGTSCPVIETIRGSDFVLLVTEPTPFGLNDLKLAVEMVRKIDIPFAVGVNRAGIGDDGVERYCRDEGIKIMLEIAYDRRIAEAYSRGIPILTALPEYGALFEDVGRKILEGQS
jgi:MinD superfamily P-loop ATPase